MLRSVGAVATGYLTIGVLIILTDRLISTPSLSLKYFVVTLVTDFLYTVVGGFLCATIAGEQARGASLSLIAFGELLGVVSLVRYWSAQPHWFAIVLLLIYPAAIWIGYKLSPTRKKSTVASV
jgi:hypothetical protein